MKLFRLAALLLALVGGSLALSGAPASATPLGAGTLGTTAAQSHDRPLVSTVQYYRRGGYYRPAYRVRRVARPYYYRRPVVVRRYGYRPRLVCRVRYTAYGPRRVCFRRF